MTKTLLLVGLQIQSTQIGLASAFKGVAVEWAGDLERAAAMIESGQVDAALIHCCTGFPGDIGRPGNPVDEFVQRAVDGKVPYGRLMMTPCSAPLPGTGGAFQLDMMGEDYGSQVLDRTAELLHQAPAKA